MQKQVPLDGFQNVAASGVAICELNKFLGQELEKITLVLGGTSFTRSMVSKVELKANAKVIWESDGAKVNASNLYLGQPDDATILKLDLMDRKAMTVNARQVGALDLGRLSGVANLRLEVTIAGATAPTLAGFVDVSASNKDPDERGIRQLVARRHRATWVVPAGGTFDIPVPHKDPSGGGSTFRRIYIYSANLTSFKTVRDGVVEHELTRAQNEASQKDNGRTPQAGLVVFDPCQDNQVGGRMWDTRPRFCRSAQFLGTFSAGETITIETDELIDLRAY